MKQFFLIYLIEVSVIIIIFYLIYRSIYNKYFYYEWNRIFLILSIFISLIIPLIEIQYFQTSSNFTLNTKDILQINLQNNEIFIATEKSTNFFGRIYNFLNSSKYLTFINIILIIYISGIIRHLIVFTRNLLSINKLKKNALKKNITHNNKYKLYTTNSKITAFSYLKSIFVNKKFEKLSEKEKTQIIEHEKIHIKQQHTIDILFFEILNIIFWFNPVMKQYKKKVIENHEFIVDSTMVKKDKSYNYTKLMLKLSSVKKNSIIINYSDGALKNRVKQIIEPEQKRIKKIRFLATIPVILIIIFFCIFFNNVINSSLVSTKNTMFITSDSTQPQAPCKNMEIITPFFEEKIISDPYNNDIKYKLSHKKITIKTKNNIKIYASGDGIISKIDTINNWGLDEITIELKMKNNYTAIYEKLEQIEVILNQKIKSGQIIAKIDDIRLYPAFNYQLLHNNKPINPKF